MSRQTVKIVPFTPKRREVRVHVTATGELVRVIQTSRPRPDDDGPRAA